MAREGVSYLLKDDDVTALKLFNAAIKFGPEVSEFHLLAGMAYHIGFKKTGNSELRDNAEIGYKLAGKFSPRDSLPWLQLGRLYMDEKFNEQALDAFAKAAELQPSNPEALSGIVQASYLTGNIKTALWATEELSKHNWDKATINRMRAVLYTVSGQEEKAFEHKSAYAQSQSKNPEVLKLFEKRLEQINSDLESLKWLSNSKTPITKNKPDILLAQSRNSDSSAQAVSTIDQSTPDATAMVVDSAQMGQPNPVGSGMMGAQPIMIDRTVKSWMDCKTFPEGVNASGMGGMGGMGGMQGFPGGNVHIFHGTPLGFQQALQKPTPIVKHLDINMEQVLNGANIPLEIERWILENGVKVFEKETFYVAIPQGIDEGELLIIRDKGNIINDNVKGDIKIFIKIINDTIFKRSGLDLILEKNITLKESLCGFSFEIKYINAKVIH